MAEMSPAVKRHLEIRANPILASYEILGFEKGIINHKPSVQSASLVSLNSSFCKQYIDFQKANSIMEQLQALADIRTVAGLMFLKILESAET